MQHDSLKTVPKTEPPRKQNQSRWFKHDSSAHNDPKIYRLVSNLGYEGYGIFWLTIEILRDAPGSQIQREALEILYRKEGISNQKVSEFLSCCLDLGLLHEVAGVISSERLSNDMQALSSAGRKAGLASAQSKIRESVCDARQRALTAVDGVQRTATDNLILSSLIRSRSDLEGGVGGARAIPPEPPPVGDLEEAAEKYLEPTDSERVRKSKFYLVTGRRPLKDYPNVYLSRPEFCDLLRQLKERNIFRDGLKAILADCESRMKTVLQRGEDPERKTAFAWCSGFLLENYLSKEKKTVDLERAETYLEGARL